MDCGCGSVEQSSSRRDFLARAGGGFGMLALASLLKQESLLAQADPSRPLAPKVSHFAPRARSVIFLFMSGGPSHVDLFEHKPELDRLAGQPIPESFGMFKTRRAVAKNKLMPGRWPFHRRGECGMEIADSLPEIGAMADDLCLFRGCHGDSVTHPESVYLMNTGSILMGRPSLGSWAAYGLGTENQDMPASSSSRIPPAGRRAGRLPGATATCRRPTRGRSCAAARRRSCT